MQTVSMNTGLDKTGFGIKLDAKNVRELAQEVITSTGSSQKLRELLDGLDAKGFNKSKITIGDTYSQTRDGSFYIDGEFIENIYDTFSRDVIMENPALPNYKYVFQVSDMNEKPSIQQTLEHILPWDFKSINELAVNQYLTEFKSNNPLKLASKKFGELIDGLRNNGSDEQSLVKHALFAEKLDVEHLDNSVDKNIQNLVKEIEVKQKQVRELQKEYNNQHVLIDETTQKNIDAIRDTNELDEIVSMYS